MATTYDLIASQTLGSSAASITFSSIAASWTDLRLVLTAISGSSNTAPVLTFNNDTGTNYSVTTFNGNGASTYSSSQTSASNIYPNYTVGFINTTYFALYDFNIFSYKESNYKTVLVANSGDKNGSGNSTFAVGLWRNTAAITSLTITVGTTMASGTTAQLYGIKAA